MRLLGIASVLCLAAGLQAGPLLVSDADLQVANGGDWSLGFSFLTNTNETVTSLGYYDQGQDGLAAAHTVGLFDSAGTLLGSVVVGPGTGNSLIGDFRYADLGAPIDLASGQNYFLIGTTLGDADGWVYQADTMVFAPGNSYVSSWYIDGAGGNLSFPTSEATDRQYMTANLLLNDASVPEPTTWLTVVGGLAGCFVFRKRITS